MLADHDRERVGVFGRSRGRFERRQVVSEVSYQLRDSTTGVGAAEAAGRCSHGYFIPRRLGSPIPSGMQAAAKLESWARSRRSGVNPLPVMLDSSRRP